MREELTTAAQWLQTYIDMVSGYLSRHPAMTTLKSIHSNVMTKYNTVADAVYSKAVVVANPQMYTDAIYSVHTYVNGAIKNSRLATSINVSPLTGLSDSVMYRTKYYLKYYDVTGNLKRFLISAKNVAAEHLNAYLTHYIDQTLNDFKVRRTITTVCKIVCIPTTCNFKDIVSNSCIFMTRKLWLNKNNLFA